MYNREKYKTISKKVQQLGRLEEFAMDNDSFRDLHLQYSIALNNRITVRLDINGN